ncbi:Defective in cullin neddylation protein [Mycena chlorophos]|uniref:Defective in cullin neddylation protein n=1 Tax=Mycena chlorophos TaxID=658473 RepID=A0A8H6WLP7_MYCCL|nr:Defective in cullin neddylation protein [Mycena chlorophos]
MPPKRKRDTEATEAAPSRSTRSSARQSNTSTGTKDASPPPAKKTSTRKKKSDDVEEAAPAPKKAKTAKKPAAKKGKKAADDSLDTGEAEPKLDDTQSKSQPPPTLVSTPPPPIPEPAFDADPKSLASEAPLPPPPASAAKPMAPKPAPAPKTAPAKIEPYSADRAASLFKEYADDDEPDVMGPENLGRFCTDADIPMDGSLPLILAWQLDAKEMGKFTKSEWTKGTDAIKISTAAQLAMFVKDLEQVLTKGKLPKSTSKKDPYDRTAVNKYAANPTNAFQTFYMYCFNYAKPECVSLVHNPAILTWRRVHQPSPATAKLILLQTSVALWSVSLVPKYPIMAEVLEFINQNEGSYKATNKDLWSMMLEFCTTVKPTLEDYEADGAWPTLLDDFVAWKKEKATNGNGTSE